MRPGGPGLSQPPNVGEAKIAATDYYNSGAYQRDIIAVTEEASAWIAERAPQVERPALVLDIDDTSLTNWEVIMADDFGRIFNGPCDTLPAGPCGWVAWDLRAATPAIEQTLAVFAEARVLDVAVFFITGRDETQRAATEKNLSSMGYGDYAGLSMNPWAPTSHRPPTSRRRSGQRSKRTVSPSSPTWAISLPTSRAATPSGRFSCPIPSTGSRSARHGAGSAQQG